MRSSTAYLFHVLVWMLPVIAIQWALAWRALARNLKAVLIPPLLAGTYYSLADSVAVREGIWYFDPSQIIGAKAGPLPVEEILFFFLTALMVSQSLVMFLPKGYRK